MLGRLPVIIGFAGQCMPQCMRDKFIQAFREDPNQRYQVLPSPAPGTLIAH